MASLEKRCYIKNFVNLKNIHQLVVGSPKAAFED